MTLELEETAPSFVPDRSGTDRQNLVKRKVYRGSWNPAGPKACKVRGF
jgi:hypothetical protein